MRAHLLAILIFGILATTSDGQNDARMDFGTDLLKQAESSFCKGDSIRTIEILEDYIEKYPDNGTTVLIAYRLAELYHKTDNDELAISLLTKAIEIKSNDVLLFSRGSCNLYNGLEPASIKANICVALSKMYALRGDHLSAMKFLNLADTVFLPNYGDCANGILMHRTNLSMHYADLYLQTGDTSKAVDRLIDFFLSDEGNDSLVTERLKSILLLTYTQDQITDEVNNCINSMQIIHTIDNVDTSEPIAGETLFMTLFDRTIQKPAQKDLKYYKNYYKRHRNLLTLTNG